MGRRDSRRRKGKCDFDSEDDSASSSSTFQDCNQMTEIDDRRLDDCLDSLYEKRGSTRENALIAIIEAFSCNLEHEFAKNNYLTLSTLCFKSIKRGIPKETSLACRVLGFLVITLGSSDPSHEILQESHLVFSESLRSTSDSSASLLECLSILTFVGGENTEDTEKSMEIIWQSINPNSSSDLGTKKKTPPTVIIAMISAWSLLATTTTTIHGSRTRSENWDSYVLYMFSLLEKEQAPLRMAAGEALALVYELISEGRSGLKSRIINKVRDLRIEAGGRGACDRKDYSEQRHVFKDVGEFLENGVCPKVCLKIGGKISVSAESWVEITQLNMLRRFMGGGFMKHLKENGFLKDVFGIRVVDDDDDDEEKKMVGISMRKMYRASQDKERTQWLNKQRVISRGRKHSAREDDDEY